MNSLDLFFQNDIVQALGWTILHSFWQGLLIVVLLTISLVLLRKHSSRIRYLVAYVALLALAVCSIGTLIWYLPGTAFGASSYHAEASIEQTAMEVASVLPIETTATVPAKENYWQSFIQFLEGNLHWVTIIWMFGVLILTLRFLAELAYIQRLKYQPGGLSMDSHQDLLNKLSRQMGIQKFIELKENLRIDSPMVIGFIKPVILVPFGLLSQLDTKQVESILTHELAHIRRHDYLFNLFQSLVEILLFFNPATWWIAALIRDEREHSCDEMAIAETGDQLAFVKTLAKLEEYRIRPTSIAMAFNGHKETGVLGRIKRIINTEEQFRVPYKLFWSCLILISSFGLFAFQGQAISSQDVMNPLEKVLPQEEPVLVEETSEETAEMDQQSEEAPKNTTNQVSITKENNKEDLGIRTMNGEEVSNGLDTLTPKLKELRRELMNLKETFQNQEMMMQKQRSDLKQAQLKLEQEIQKMENDQHKKIYEIEKKGQQIQLDRNIKLKEMELQLNAMETEALEFQFKMEKLAAQMNEEGRSEELKKQMSVLQEKVLDMEKKKRTFQMEQNREGLEIDKELQQLNHQKWQLTEEAKISMNDKRLKMFELEQKMQETQYKSQMLQSDLENKMQRVQQQIEEEMFRMRQEREE